MTTGQKWLLGIAVVLGVLGCGLGGYGLSEAVHANRSGPALTAWATKARAWEQHVNDCHSSHGATCPTPTDHIPPPPPPPAW